MSQLETTSIAVAVSLQIWEMWHSNSRSIVRFFRIERGGGGVQPQEPEPKNQCWNGRPCKFRRHEGFSGM